MAVVSELFAGRSEIRGEKPSAEIPYVVTEAADEAEVLAAITAAAPVTHFGMQRKTIEITERVNEDTWKVTVRYEGPEEKQEDPAEEPEPAFSFDTGGGTQHITQSIRTVNSYGPKASSLLGGAIGFDGEHVQGVDISVPVFNFSEERIVQHEQVTVAYKKTIFDKTGKVNSSPFRGFAAGEVLFLGASGSRRGAGDWEITFRFSALPNRTNLRVGDIAGIEKKGWEYLWVQYADDLDPNKQQLIKTPAAVYVEQVYESVSFADLGVG